MPSNKACPLIDLMMLVNVDTDLHPTITTPFLSSCNFHAVKGPYYPLLAPDRIKSLSIYHSKEALSI